MPLIILGLIVVLGAALLIYYQLGPKVTLRLKGANKFGAAASDDDDGAEAGDGEDLDDLDADFAAGTADGKEKKAEDEKVLYIFGDGERMERPLKSDGDQGGGQNGQGDGA
jgi:hypothetical protein